MLVWDNLNTHLTAGVKHFIAEHDWLTIIRLPAYAPQLSAVEGIWSLIRLTLANTAFTDPEHLIAAIRHQLRTTQHGPWLIDGALAETGLPLAPTPHDDISL